MPEFATITVHMKDSDGAWQDMSSDVLQDPPLTIESGIRGVGPLDLVADTGIATFALDNSSNNTGGLASYYTPGSSDCRAGFAEGTEIKITFTYDAVAHIRFYGTIRSLEITPSRFERPMTLVECSDWMEFASKQRLGEVAIQSNKRADEALTTIAGKCSVTPQLWLGTGQETWDSIFDRDDAAKMTIASMFQKIALNEYGQIWCSPTTSDGTLAHTLVFHNRHYRTKLADSDAVLTFASDMHELEIEYSRDNLYNLVQAKIFPSELDTTTDATVWNNQVEFSILPGEALEMRVLFRDAVTGQRLSVADVISPLVAGTDYDFGSTEGASTDMTGDLGIVTDIGGNSALLTLTNNGTRLGYVNMLKLRGTPIYTYDPQTFESVDSDSVAIRGEQVLSFNLEQQDSPNKGLAWASYIRSQTGTPRKVLESVGFVANASSDMMTAALTAWPSSVFVLTHKHTAIAARRYHVQHVALELAQGRMLTCRWTAVPAGTADYPYMIYDVTPGWDYSAWAF